METKINSLVTNLLQHYRTVQDQLNLAADLEGNVSRAEILRELKGTLDRIKAIELQLFPLRDSFVAGGGTLSDQTHSLIQQSIDIVSRLIPQLGTMEQQSRQAKLDLAPEIHDGVRTMKMLSAYAQNR